MLVAALSWAVSATAAEQTLAIARKGHDAGVTARSETNDAPPVPPSDTFQLVRYPAPPGPLAAYLTPDPKDGAKHPAIVWITGGDSAAIGDMWTAQPADNDQSAAAFRKAGIVLMAISLRGGNDNPGEREGLFGETNDVKAAGDYLASVPYVDPARIYLGGHSTGATLTLLTVEATDRFRAAFAFGPIASPSHNYMGYMGVKVAGDADLDRRSPVSFLNTIKTPTYVIEGDSGNIVHLNLLKKYTANPRITFLPVPRASHFSVLAPATELVAKRILADTGAKPSITFTDAEMAALMPK